jgi:hypothetical protein
MRQPTKLQVFANFWQTKKNVTTLYHPSVLSRFISARLFSVPQVENEIERTPLCRCCWDPRSRTDELKKVEREDFSAAFQKLYDRVKACIYASGDYFEYKKVCVFLMCLRFKIKSVLKHLGRIVYNEQKHKNSESEVCE